MTHRHPCDPFGLRFVGRAAEVREMDRRTIEELGIPGVVLMELAGAGTAEAIFDRTGGRAGGAVVLCGGGNNGGDGYVIARHLRDAGWRVRCLATTGPATLRGDAAHNHGLLARLGGQIDVIRAGAEARWGSELAAADVVVDALFGTGLDRAVGGVPRALIELASEVTRGLRVAVDIPSGVHADTGEVLGVAFAADVTATFALPKPGLLLHPGAAHAGEVVVVPIALPRDVLDAVGPSVRLADDAAVARMLPRRGGGGGGAGDSHSHKGSFGHVGVIGGFASKEGAGVLACLGALRAGAGLVTWCTPTATTGLERPPEVMHHALAQGLPERPTVFVVGPGLGTDAAAETALREALAADRPTVVDADGLSLLAAGGAPSGGSAPRVWTPHPGEAARLLGVSVPDVQRDRLGAARRLVEAAGATVVLKGARTVVAEPGRPAVIIPAGDPTLAAGGTGDVLAGVVAALLAQGCPAFEAAVAGAYVHGLAGERAGCERARRGALASEVAGLVPLVMHELLAGW